MVGLACGCVCAACGRKLQACSLDSKVNKVKPYFRHDSDVHNEGGNGSFVCSSQSANESALHMMAKQIIQEEKRVYVPKKPITLQDVGLSDIPQKIQNQIQPLGLKGREVKGDVSIEKPLDNFKPDAIITTSRGNLLVEILVSHKVNEKKEEKAKQHGEAMLEIDLSSFRDKNISSEIIREVIVSNQYDHLKNWIHYPLSKTILNEYLKEYENLPEIKQYRQRQKRENKIKELFEPANYANEIAKLRQDSLFSKNYAKYNKSHYYDFGEHFEQTGAVPFFVDIPISGEMIFQCDRRIWQSILFNHCVYDKTTEGQQFNVDDLFDVLKDEYKIPVDYDLLYKLPNPTTNNGTIWLRSSVVKQYIDYLKTIGFVASVRGLQPNWISSVSSGTIIPINKTNSDDLFLTIKNVGSASPDVDNLIGKEFAHIVDIRKKQEKERARKEAEERARREAEERARREAEERARKEAEERARKEAEERARKEAEERVRRDVEERVRKEVEERVRKEVEERVYREVEERVRREAEERVHKEAEEQARREAKEQSLKKTEEWIRKESEELARKEAEKDFKFKICNESEPKYKFKIETYKKSFPECEMAGIQDVIQSLDVKAQKLIFKGETFKDGENIDLQNIDFDDQTFIFDQYGRRLVKCIVCGEIKRLCSMEWHKYCKGVCGNCFEKLKSHENC